MQSPFHFDRRRFRIRWSAPLLILALLMAALLTVTSHHAQAAPDAGAFPDLYWVNNTANTIQFSTNGSTVQTLLNTNPATAPSDVEIDVAGSKIYWIENSQIKRANLDGSSVQTIVSVPTIIRAIALDTANGHLYFVDVDGNGEDFIGRMNLDGSNRQNLFSHHTDLTGYTMTADLAFDPNTGSLYWLTTNNNSLIRRSLPNGANRQTVIANPGYSPRRLRLDLTNQKMYWTSNALPHSIQRANLDGTGKEILVTNISLPLGFDIDIPNGKMYWTNGSTPGSLQRANLDGTDIETLIPNLGTDSSGQLSGLALISGAAQPASLPLLDMPDDLTANPATTVDVPLVFTGNGNHISAVDLDLSYPTICLAPDLTDANTDGIPDNFVLNQSGFQIGVDSADAANGSIQIVISADANTDPISTFADGALLTIPFNVVIGCSGPVNIDLSATSWGDSGGQSTQGETQGGTVTVNSPPDAEDDYFTVSEDDGSLNGNLFVNNGAGADSDPDGDTLTVLAVNGNTGYVGQAISFADATVTVQSDGSFVYSFGAAYNWLAVGETQVDSFGYELGDGNFTDLSIADIGTVEITVNGQNDAPTASFTGFVDDMEVLEPGWTFNLNIELSDPDTSDTVSIDIDWGDGSPHSPVDTETNQTTFMGSKVYNAPGVFNVTGTADDGNGGSATDTMLAVVGTRGDCNGDGPVDAGDLPAFVLEYFDGDDSDNWLDTLGAGSTFAGNPVGCDANNDEAITAGDLSCQINILLDPAGYSCAGTTAAKAAQAVLSLAAVDAAAQSGPVRVPVTLHSNGHAVVAAVFSLNLGGAAFDATDANGDGIPDAVSVNLPGDVQAMAFYDPADVGSELDLVLFSDSLTPFPDGELLAVTLTGAETLTFSADSAASLGGADGSSVPVLAQDGVTAERKIFLPFATR
jgi:VCBS repeat-containing protein